MRRGTRREFIRSLGAVAAAPAALAAGTAGGVETTRVRTIAYNVLECTGFPASKAKRLAHDHKREMARRFAEALRRFSPDLVTMSEAPEKAQVREIARQLGMGVTFFASGQSWPGALLTRYRVIESRNCPIQGGTRPRMLFTRHWGMARLETPLGEIIVHSLHLHPSDSTTRAWEIDEVLKTLRSQEGEGTSLLVQGDFNHAPDAIEYEKWKAAGLVDAFAEKGAGQRFTIRSDNPTRRIDFVWAKGPLAEKLLEARTLAAVPFRRNARDPDSFALSDHLPVMATFGG